MDSTHPSLKRMRLWVKDKKDEDFMEFHYNPSEINVAKAIDFEDDEVPGFMVTRPQFKQGKARKFSFTLFLNELGEHESYRGTPKIEGVEISGRTIFDQDLSQRRRPVEEAIEWLEQHAVPTKQSSVESFDGNEPPLLMFQCWEVVTCYITNLNIKRTIFHPTDFQARRATVDIELTEYLDHPGSGGMCEFTVTACFGEGIELEVAREHRRVFLRGKAFGDLACEGYDLTAPVIVRMMYRSRLFFKIVENLVVRRCIDYAKSRLGISRRKMVGSSHAAWIFMWGLALVALVRRILK